MKMELINSIGVSLFVLLQFVNIQLAIDQRITCLDDCYSAIYDTDWTGERLKLEVTKDNRDSGPDNYIGLESTNSATLIKLICSRRTQITTKGSVTTKSFPSDKVKLVNGSALYINDSPRPWCSWAIQREDNSTFPMELIEPPKLNVTPNEYQIIIHLNETLPIDEGSFSSLSDQLIQRFGDYSLIGNSRYQLFRRVTDRIDFGLAVNYEDEVRKLFPKIVSIHLVQSPYAVIVECDFTSNVVDGYLMFGDYRFWTDFTGRNFNDLTNNRITNRTVCEWSIPKRIDFGQSYGRIDVTSGTFNLTITADKRFTVMDEVHFKL